MMYLIAGNGNANKKEVLLTLESLHEEDTAFLFVEEETPSLTMLAICEWVTKNGIWHEAVVTSENDSFYNSADEVYTAKRPLDRALKVAPARCQPGEKWALLILSDNIDEDEQVLYAISRTIEAGAPVYDLGGQMTQITLEEEEEAFPLLEMPTADDFVLPQAAPEEKAEEVKLDYNDLKDLTVAELKSVASSRSVYPRDLRSKDSIIAAILEIPEEVAPALALLAEEEEAPKLQEVAEKAKVEKRIDNALDLFYLVTVRADGSAEMRQITANQAASL
jgi:hypothetical protein